jgi:hypothetical protein
MYELKTKANEGDVTGFLNAIPDEAKRKDAFALLELMKKATKEKPKMWGTSIIGFGSYHYKYDSGHEGDMCKIGFSPRKQNFSIYLQCIIREQEDLLKQLGKHKPGAGCLYINKLADVDMSVLKKLIERCV